MKIVLASTSKYRQAVLKMIGLKYEVITSGEEEKSREIRPDKYVEEISLIKATSVSKKIKDKAIIIAADMIIYFNGKKYEKPKTKQEAYNNLKELSGQKNTVYTGITIMDLYQNKTISLSSKVDVYLKDISEEEIKWYVNNENEIFKTCGYAIFGKAALFIDKIEGDHNILLGISPRIIFEKLNELGYSVNDFEFEK